MADDDEQEQGQRQGQGAGAGDRSGCTPCRGTGKLTSGLGGTPHEVTCPWCGGTGVFQSGHDAQQKPAEGA